MDGWMDGKCMRRLCLDSEHPQNISTGKIRIRVRTDSLNEGMSSWTFLNIHIWNGVGGSLLKIIAKMAFRATENVPTLFCMFCDDDSGVVMQKNSMK